MGLHSLGSGVYLTRVVQRDVDAAIKLANRLIDDYKNQGLDVVVRAGQDPNKIKANIRNSEGTDIDATVTVKKIDESSSELIIELYGDIFVGGFSSFFVTESLIVSEAKKRLNAFLDSIL